MQDRQQKSPNPQGKGMVPVLAALSDARQQLRVPPKHVEQVSSELFTSLFVLESEFRFKPVVGNQYWLYHKQARFSLSLLAPGQWRPEVYGQYIGCCELHHDLSWTLELSAEALQDQALMAKIDQQRTAFEQALVESEKLDDMLPVFLQELPFYQRVFASALAGSLGSSMQQAGIRGLSYTEAKGLLERRES